MFKILSLFPRVVQTLFHLQTTPLMQFLLLKSHAYQGRFKKNLINISSNG